MNKDTIRHSALVLVFLGILAALLAAASWVYRPRDNTKQGGMDYVMAHGYLGEPAGSIDVFFVGSSEFYSGIAPMPMWERSGLSSYDFATGAQRSYNADAMVRELLQTHHPRLVVLDGYVALKQGNPDEAVFTKLSQWFPVLINHENWKRFDWETICSPVAYTHREINKGFRPDGRHAPASYAGFMTPSEERADLPLLNRLYLDHIMETCREAGVEVLFITLPSPENWDYARHNTLQDYADAAGVPLLDLNLMVTELGIDPECDYRDGGDHLNSAGAEKVSAYLADYLRETYHLEDHREDPALAGWKEDIMLYPEH